MLSMNTHWFTYTLVPSLITASIPKFWNCLQLLISLFLRVIGLCISRALSGLFVVRSRGWKKWSILLIKYKEDQEDNHTSKGMLMCVIVDLYFTRFHRFRCSDDPSTQEHVGILFFFSSAPTSCKLLSTFPMYLVL